MKNYYFMADLLQHSWCCRLPGSSFHTNSSLQVQEGGRAKCTGTRGREGNIYRQKREDGQHLKAQEGGRVKSTIKERGRATRKGARGREGNIFKYKWKGG